MHQNADFKYLDNPQATYLAHYPNIISNPPKENPDLADMYQDALSIIYQSDPNEPYKNYYDFPSESKKLPHCKAISLKAYSQSNNG